MADYRSETIYDLISDIEKQKLVLPAIQRSFVWDEQRICKLFDSIIRDYPIGTFLFWRIDDDEIDELPLNAFINKYDEQHEELNRGKPIVKIRSEYTGVLDGQQRITSLYMGLTGSRRTRRWGAPKAKDSSYVTRVLAINVFHMPKDDEDSYDLAFVEYEQTDHITKEDDEAAEKLWVEAAIVMDPELDVTDCLEEIEEQDDSGIPWVLENRRIARKVLTELHKAVHSRPSVSYYEAGNKTLSQVVEIFVRVNSGGEKLSASDLMLSIASGAQKDDIHAKIRDALDTINQAPKQGDGFVANKDLFLKAGLMFTGAKSLSLQHKNNYSIYRVNLIYAAWDEIVDAIATASKLIEYLGIKGAKVTSRSLILPIAYYLYHNKIDADHIITSTKPEARKSRILIRQWLLRAMINSIFRDGTDSTLLGIRKTIDGSTRNYFPLDDLMASATKRKLTVSDEAIEEILEYTYGDGRTLALLLELCKAPEGYEYHVDHIWPKATLAKKSELKKRGVPDSEWAFYQTRGNDLANLQPLFKLANEEKGEKPFDEWVATVHSSKSDRYFDDCCIPRGIDYSFNNFKEFYELREVMLKKRIRECLPDDFPAILKRYSL